MARTQVPASEILDGSITDTDVATANKDGTAATPSMRTLGTGAQQATAGNDARLVSVGNWKLVYTDSAGAVQGLAVGAGSTVLVGNGVTAAPSFTDSPQLTSILDTGSAARLTFATTSPHVLVGGDLALNTGIAYIYGNTATPSAPNARCGLLIGDSGDDYNDKMGLGVFMGQGFALSANNLIAIGGKARGRSNTTTTVAGLDFEGGHQAADTGTKHVYVIRLGLTYTGAGATLTSTGDLIYIVTAAATLGGTATAINITGLSIANTNSPRLTKWTGITLGSTSFDTGTTVVGILQNGPARTADTNGNFFRNNAQFGSITGAFGTGDGVIGIANATTVPTTNPSGGGVLYATAGALLWRDSAGTVSTLSAGTALPSGCIVMWHGPSASIPSGWVLCDGNNSTPDLRQRFIYGATADSGSLPAASMGGSTILANHIVTQPNDHANHVFTHENNHDTALTHNVTQPSAHVFTQPTGHSNHVFTQPSAHGITQPVVANHVFTQPSAHSITQPAFSAHSNHVFTQPDNHLGHAHNVPIGIVSGVLYARNGMGVAFSESGHVTVTAGSSSQTAETASDLSSAQAHANGAVDAHSAHSLSTSVDLTNNHSGGSVDAHSLNTNVALTNNHAGGGVDAHSAHSGGAVDAHSGTAVTTHPSLVNHSGGNVDSHSRHVGMLVSAHSPNVPPYYALCFIMKS